LPRVLSPKAPRNPSVWPRESAATPS
jgi:hypothetical protein